MILAVFLLLGITVYLLYSNSEFQTEVAQKGAAWLSNKLHTRIKIGKVKIKDLRYVELDNLFVEDLAKDTLLYTKKLSIDLLSYHKLDLKNNLLEVESLDLNEGRMFLHKDQKGRTNLQFLLDFFSGKKKQDPNSRPFTIRVKNLLIHDFHYKMENERVEIKVPHGIFNTNDMDINHIDLDVHDFFNADDSVSASIRHLSLDEKSGFKLKHLATQLRIGSHQMVFSRLKIITPQSELGDQFEMHFKSIDDFDDFEDQVFMRAHLSNTHLASKDLAYFSSALAKMNLNANISGSGRGKLNNLRLRNMEISTASHTLIKGNFIIKGLPNVQTTFMDLNFSDLQSNRKDAETLLQESDNSEVIKNIPKEINTLGNLQYKGHFLGFYNDFVANGTLKTAIGNVTSDINMKFLPHKVPEYSGMMSTENFEIGKLLGESDLGKLSLNAEIKGKGFTKNETDLIIDSHISSFGYRGYNYKNISIKGKRVKNLFSGNLKIDDQNLKLGFKGNVNLNGHSPVYKFIADISYADLLALHFIKDSIVIKTKLDIDAKGSNLNDIEGRFMSSKITVVRNGVSHDIDSLKLLATKHGNQRSLQLSSCLLNASLTGNYNLANFPSAIEKVLYKYIPSGPWGKITPTKNQDFAFHIDIIDAEPILTAFLPNYKMPGTSSVQGKFDSKTGRFSTSGTIHELDVDQIEFNNISFEGENEEKSNIDFNLSADSISLNHKILAQNLNIATDIQNDSLMFNIKVSDVNAVNHLDLNGHIGFNDRIAGLSILPSELVLDRKSWQIENKFKVLFEKDLVRINGFGIHHNDESLIINGALSSQGKDTVIAEFHKFDIAAINQILREYNLQLNGKLNGKAYFSSVLTHPSFSSNLGIDSLAINQVYVGRLGLNDTWNGTDKTITFDGKIHRKLVDVVNLTGNIGLQNENSPINVSLKLNKAEAVILQPLVGTILSDLKGTLSSNLQVSGTRSAPLINGNIKLENTEFTINYLKTHYKVNDQVNFDQGQINIQKLTLTDNFYTTRRPSIHVANLSGQIDLSHLSRPYFDVNVHASNFLCLNTTEKDNDQYYGEAFATGDFSFDGPIETMNIDISATTNKGTTFNIPLNRPNTAGHHDYISFVKHTDSVEIARHTKNIHNGVTMNFNLNITPDANARLIFDQSIGDVIRGAGNSDLNLQITPEGDFLIYGTFEIDHGDYLFTSQNVLNKLFTVERGGTVRFTGDPLTAQLNLHANYQARTSIINLYDAANVQPTNASAQDQSVLVDCRINLEGDLAQPVFDFDLLFPNDPNIEYDLQTYLSSNEVVTSQSMLFLVSNQFNGKLTPLNGVAIATSTGVQFLSSQLSNLLTNFSSKVDLNFRSLSDVGLNYHMLGDRMLLTGNLASTTTAADVGYNPTALLDSKTTGNLEAAYLLNKQRNLTLRAFFKPVPFDVLKGYINSNPPTIYTQGLGIVYEKDFSSLKSIFHRKSKIPKLIPPEWQGSLKAKPNTPGDSSKQGKLPSVVPIDKPVKKASQ